MARAIWRITIDLESAILTPLHSGTLFGQLCWAYRALRSEQNLIQWLREQSDEPFLVSDAMPSGYLPRPILPPMTRGKASLYEVQNAKRLRKAAWIKRELFASLSANISEASLMAGLAIQSEEKRPFALGGVRRAHNTIDRLTGTTPEAGGLYFVDESWPDEKKGSGKFDVYIGTSMDGIEVRKLFEFVGNWGFGRDASTGKGRWRCEAAPETAEWFGDGGTRRLSLSHGTLTPNMVDPRYKLAVHYGKTGGGYGMTQNPFKHPITLLRPGATFRHREGEPKRWGELLQNVHPEKPWIVHQAEHLTVGYSEAPRD